MKKTFEPVIPALIVAPAGIQYPPGKPPAGDSEFRVMKTRTAVARETALPAEFPGASPAAQLAALCDRLLATSKMAFQPGEKTVGRCTDRNGHTLECVFDGADQIDGVPVDYDRWPVLDNPWLRQDAHSDRLVADSCGKSAMYDFVQWRNDVRRQ